MKERWRQDTNYPRKQLLEQAAGSAKDDEGADAYFSPFLSFSSFPFSRSLFFFLPLSFFFPLTFSHRSISTLILSLSTLIVYVYFTVSIFVCFAFVVLFFLSQVSLLSHFSLVLSLTLSRRFYICFSFMHHALGLHVALAYWTPLHLTRKFNQSNLVKFSGSNLLSIKFNHSNFCHVHCLSG